MSRYKPLKSVVQALEQGLPPAPGGGFLGADLDPADAALVLIPVPWDATASYGQGTARGPAAMLAASHQLDLEDGAFGTPYRAGIAFAAPDPLLAALNESAAGAVRKAREAAEQGRDGALEAALVNAAGGELNQRVHAAASALLQGGRAAAVVGGDHSSPYGLIRALAERQSFGVLHLDAHHDLRAAYEGFTWSHASILRNVMERLPQVTRLVSVGVRDYCREERDYLASLGSRARCFYGRDLFRRKAAGETYGALVRDILEPLPERVYLSFDVDGLDPPYCPSTGTPVPGGLSFDEACYLLEELAGSGRRVLGFDLCEVAPGRDGGEWDANVGARLLYKLCGCLLRSQGLC